MSARDDAMTTIRRLAMQHELAVSVITPEDVLSAAGFSEDDLTPERLAAVLSSWEWKHYGDGWSDWFENVDLS